MAPSAELQLPRLSSRLGPQVPTRARVVAGGPGLGGWQPRGHSPAGPSGLLKLVLCSVFAWEALLLAGQAGRQDPAHLLPSPPLVAARSLASDKRSLQKHGVLVCGTEPRAQDGHRGHGLCMSRGGRRTQQGTPGPVLLSTSLDFSKGLIFLPSYAEGTPAPFKGSSDLLCAR